MIFRRFALLLVVVALVACNNEKNRNLIDRRVDQATQMGKEAQQPAPKKTYNPLTVSDKVWSGNKSIRLHRGVPLPSKFEAERGITLISSEPVSLGEIAAAISVQTGIPFRLTDGLSSGGGGRSSALSLAPPPATSNMMGGGAAPSASAPSGGGGHSDNTMSVSYEGSLSGLLDLVSGNFGVNWKFDGQTIRFGRYETRVFVIETLPGSQSFTDGIGEDSSSGGGGGGGSGTAGGSFSASSTTSLKQSSEMSVELKVWDELNQSLTSILGGVGSVVLSPSSGTATVTTSPEIMQTVAKFIEEENKRLTQQIAINVEIYSVAMADNTDFNVTFDAAFKKLSDVTVGLTTGSDMVAGANPDTLTNLSIAIVNPKKFGNLGSVFAALSSIGDTARVAQFPMTTLNNKTVARRVGRDVTYVASLTNTTSTSTSGFSSSQITPATVREGFSLQLTPRLLSDGRIMMQYSLSLVDIVRTRSLNTGAGTVELPETSSRVFVQQAMLRSGSTLVLGGVDDEKVEQESKGVGNAYNYFLGGGSTNTKTRTMMFVAITPQVIEIPRASRESE